MCWHVLHISLIMLPCIGVHPAAVLPCCCCRGHHCRALWVDGNYTGTVAVGNASHPFKTLTAAWAALPAAPKTLTAGVTIYIKPVGDQAGPYAAGVQNTTS